MLATLSTARKRNYTLSLVGLAALLLMAALPLATGLHSPDTRIPASQNVDFGKLPLSFEANEGQTDPSVKYMAHASGGTMYFMASEVVLALQSESERQPSDAKGSVGLASLSSYISSDKVAKAAEATEAQPSTSVVRLQFLGSNPDTLMSSGEALPGKVNYFIGNDPSKWHSDLPTYGNITYSDLYSGVDLAYSGTGGQLKGTYTVAVGSDPSQIRWRYNGAEEVTVDQAGNLQITVANTNKDAQAVTVTEQVPVAWQEIAGIRIPVSVRYLVAADQSIGFVLASYDPDYPLIIDPTLAYSTYLGGNGYDEGWGIAVDASGNAYVTGFTSSSDFPLQDPLQSTHSGDYDAFVTKFSATGSTLLYSTYLGGSSYDMCRGIAVDASGNAYVTGRTTSTNFPLQNPFQPTFGGNSDAFVTKLSSTGSTLIYSTYLGGSDRDEGWGIAVDTSSNAYVTGGAGFTNFPLQNPFQPTHGGGTYDAFVTKFSATGATLLYSTYLGGSSNEISNDIAVDSSGNAYITGYTTNPSPNFPLQNPFQPTYGGGTYDVFVTKFSATGSTLIYSTYLGGNGGDIGRGIAVDTSGNAYITGYTTFSSIGFPLQNPLQPTHGGEYDVFVTKFSATGSTLIYSTYLGGSQLDFGWGIAVDASGNAYITGYTTSFDDFPLQNPFQPRYGGSTYDAFVTKFSSTGSTLDYSTYLGGNGYDEGWGIAVDASGNAYVTGFTSSTNFPLQDPFQSYYGGYDDAFVAKISDQPVSTSTPTVYPIEFTDVPEGSTFYTFIRCLASRGIISGYADGTFRPNNEVTRGQLAKIVSNAAGFTESPDPQIFEDVAPESTFYQWINRLTRRGYMSGYVCGGVGEPCTTGRPYFRPVANATRGQTSKIVANAAGFGEEPLEQTFEDVPAGHTFYREIQRLASRNIMGGYPCGGVGEPCLSGKPYFRPQNNVTRGQSAKIVANTFFPGCQTR